MSQIIVQGAQVLQVEMKQGKPDEKGNRKTFINAHIFQAGDRPQYFRASIRSDDAKEQHAMISELDKMTGKGLFDLVLDEFRWDGRVNHSYVCTLQSLVGGSAKTGTDNV